MFKKFKKMIDETVSDVKREMSYESSSSSSQRLLPPFPSTASFIPRFSCFAFACVLSAITTMCLLPAGVSALYRPPNQQHAPQAYIPPTGPPAGIGAMGAMGATQFRGVGGSEQAVMAAPHV